MNWAIFSVVIFFAGGIAGFEVSRRRSKRPKYVKKIEIIFILIGVGILAGLFYMTIKPNGAFEWETTEYVQKPDEDYMEIAELNEQLRGAIERATKEGGDKARMALKELRQTGNFEKLQEFLINDLDKNQDDPVNRNREIAVVSYLRGDTEVTNRALDEILKLEPDDIRTIYRKGIIYQQRGEPAQAQSCHEQVLELAKKREDNEFEAKALSNLGFIFMKRGDLDTAEKLYIQSLKANEKTGIQKGMAANYSNLGNIYLKKGDLAKAEEMYQSALEINRTIERQKGIAIQYANLGLVSEMRGDLKEAEEYHEMAIKLNKEIGRLEGVSLEYTNLGVVYEKQGRLDKAEKIYLEGLELDKKLGHLEGVAGKYRNLGSVYYNRGEMNKARQYWKRSQDIYEQIGMPLDVKTLQEWLDELDE